MTEATSAVEKQAVQAEVDYLPSPQPYEHKYPSVTLLAVVRSDSMTFFGVSDHKDRDVHEFFLVHASSRITNLSQTIGQLIGEKHEVKFNLVEQITPGSR